MSSTPPTGRTWYVLACGWPEPALYETGARYAFAEIAEDARRRRQLDELPPALGGATWHVVQMTLVS